MLEACKRHVRGSLEHVSMLENVTRPLTLMLLDSVAPDVKTISRAVAPIRAATF
jgi:hypothetical protein